MTNGVINGEASFEYTYSAEQQKEIERIRKKYLPKEEDKMETLRRLDQGAERPGTAAALIVGVIGALLLGVGMCCSMVWQENLFVLGIVVGLLGIAMLSCAYPLYQRVTRKQREKIAEKVLALSEELSV